MMIKECYEAIGSSYEDVLSRLGSEVLVKRFAIKFLQDTTFQTLEEKMQEANGEDAFRAVHTLKGVCLNLGFTALGEVSSELTEAMRDTKDTSGCEELMKNVTLEYNRVIKVLRALDENE